MASRQSKRPGFGPLTGAVNSRTTISMVAPKRPKKYDIWIVADTTPGASKMYWWSGYVWIQVTT